MKTILHLCADTGSDTKPYKDAGYNVILVGSKIGVENYHPPKDVYGIIANPVCTEFSTARSNGKARNPEEGLKLVKECQRIIKEAKPKWWVIENPAKGVLKKYLGKPAFEYEPWWYGSPWTKKTALWGNFNIPERLYDNWEDVPKLEGLYIRPGRGKPSLAFMHKSHYKFIPEFQCLKKPDSDMEFRSMCSQKFAKAFFEANKQPLNTMSLKTIMEENEKMFEKKWQMEVCDQCERDEEHQIKDCKMETHSVNPKFALQFFTKFIYSSQLRLLAGVREMIEKEKDETVDLYYVVQNILTELNLK